MAQSQSLSEHKKKYSKCVACPLGVKALLSKKNRRVYYGGSFPNDILFIGEASGETELATLEPFMGNAGQYLKNLISDVFGNAYWLPDIDPTTLEHSDYDSEYSLRIGFTNSVICPPQDNPLSKLRAPKNKEITACGSRLRDIIYLSGNPKVVTCGRPAERAYKKLIDEQNKNSFDDRLHHRVSENPYYICHPSAILRQEEAGVIDQKRTLITLEKILNDLP